MPHGRPDFSPTAVDVVLRPEWAAAEATDKSFTGAALDKGFTASAYSSYTVPVGKTLYITHIAGECYAHNQADADLNQFGGLEIIDFTAGAYLLFMGLNGGGAAVFSKPLVVPAGHLVRFYMSSYANHNLDIYFSAEGYEI